MIQSFLKDPSKLSSYSFKQLKELSNQLRLYLYNQHKENNPIYYQSSMDVVELIVALFKVFDTTKDHILFDNYEQQILFDLINKKESITTQSVSNALGYALAKDITNKSSSIISVINEESLSSGEVYEALARIGNSQKKVVLLYIDYQLDKHNQLNVVSTSFSKIRTSKSYTSLKNDLKSVLSYSKLGNNLLKGLTSVKETLKDVVIKPSIFDELNIEYLGPIDSKDLKMLVGALTLAKNHQGPMVIHAIVKKKSNETLALEKELQKAAITPSKVINAYQMIDEILYPAVLEDESIVVLASKEFADSKVSHYLKNQSNRMLILEQANGFAMTLASSFAQEKLKPVVIMDSSTIEKSAYNLHHELIYKNQNITLLITNAGISKKNQNSVFNVYDVGVLMSSSNFVIAQPKDEKEAQHLIFTALQYDGPFAIRLSDIMTSYTNENGLTSLPIGYWTLEYSHANVQAIVVCYGEMVSTLVNRAKSNELPIMIVNARFLKPIDQQLLTTLANKNMPIIVYESDSKEGGLYQHIAEFFVESKMNVSLTRVGLTSPYLNADSTIQLKKVNKIDTNSLIEQIMEVIHE